MNNVQLVKALQISCQPQSPKDFQDELTANVLFNPIRGYTFNAMDFRPMYDAVQKYKTDFLLYHSFMASNNSYNTPLPNTKEGGTVKIFTDGISWGYGKSKLQAIKKQKFDSIVEFVTLFLQLVEEDYEVSKLTRSLNNSAQAAPASDAAFTLLPSPKLEPILLQTSETRKPYIPNRTDKVHKISENAREYSDLQYAPQYFYEYQDDISDDDFDTKKIPGETASKMACFKLLYSGSCDNDSCKYAHDNASILETYIKHNKQLDKQTERFRKMSAERRDPGPSK
jgi:hypothetical protein